MYLSGWPFLPFVVSTDPKASMNISWVLSTFSASASMVPRISLNLFFMSAKVSLPSFMSAARLFMPFSNLIKMLASNSLFLVVAEANKKTNCVIPTATSSIFVLSVDAITIASFSFSFGRSILPVVTIFAIPVIPALKLFLSFLFIPTNVRNSWKPPTFIFSVSGSLLLIVVIEIFIPLISAGITLLASSMSALYLSLSTSLVSVNISIVISARAESILLIVAPLMHLLASAMNASAWPVVREVRRSMAASKAALSTLPSFVICGLERIAIADWRAGNGCASAINFPAWAAKFFTCSPVACNAELPSCVTEYKLGSSPTFCAKRLPWCINTLCVTLPSAPLITPSMATSIPLYDHCIRLVTVQPFKPP